MYDVAIIGAGTAGCFAASQLTDAGLTCCIVEKSRGIGGRCSRRSVLEGFNIDLGASSFSMLDALSQNILGRIKQWTKSGYLTEWAFKSSEFQTPSETVNNIELCGSTSMNAFHRHLIDRIDCLTQRHVHKLKRLDGYWQLLDGADQLIIEAKAVIITAPAEQTYNLLQTYNQIEQYKHLSSPALNASQASLPQYICAIAFDQAQPLLSDVYTGKHPIFSKAIRVSSKPNKKNTIYKKIPEIWVLHSTFDWAIQKNHQDAKASASEMGELFCQHFNIKENTKTKYPLVVASHYWRLADHGHAAYDTENKSFSWDEDIQLGCCADWLAGGGIAAALSSSQDLSKHITSQLKQEG